MSLEWFEFHPKSFITDTMRLNTEAKGAYLLLILDYYEKEAPAPNDDDVLAAITGLSIEVWRRHRRVIEPLFAVADGLWRHTTCETVIHDRRERAEKKSAEQREKANKRWNKARGIAAGAAPAMPPASPGHAVGNATAEADFGPATTEPYRRHTDGNAAGINSASEMPPAMPPASPRHSPGNAPAMHSNSNTIREGSNEPSPAIGFLLNPEWTLTAEHVGTARADGIPMETLSEWLDDWKSRCIEAGTRVVNWYAAWEREYHRRVVERKKRMPKPKVAVSKRQRLTKIPDGWQPGATHIRIAGERGLDLAACIESFADYLVNKHPDWSDADASFRNWLKSPHRTEFIRNGQAAQRRAPAPGGASILNAFDRLDATLAAASGPAPEGQPHGTALVRRVSEE